MPSFRSVVAVRTPAPALSLDLSRDGALVVAACHAWNKGCHVVVARAHDGAVIDSFGAHLRQVSGVALCGEAVYFVGVASDGLGASLYRYDLRARSLDDVLALGAGAHFASLARDRAGQRLAILHSHAVVYDTAAGRAVATVAGSAHAGPTFGCFAPHREQVYLLGVEERALVAYDLVAGAAVDAWPAPSRGGGPVCASPDGRYVVMNGVNLGAVRVLDLADGSAWEPANWIGYHTRGPWGVTPDGAMLVHLSPSGLHGYSLPGYERVCERELTVRASHCAWAAARDAPVMAAAATEDTVAVVTLAP